ncbi:MAG: MBL fold metallo-hydrolase [Planctomycetota bacterium]|jgi:L-ascorbate metabolism protein UlaG (beta-lactamase superfamily)
MNIGNFSCKFISHVCFLIYSTSGKCVITDPIYLDGFSWKNHFEKYLTPPDLPLEEIKPCDFIFVSHIHGDHYDPDAVIEINKNTGAKVIAPEDVLDDLAERGMDRSNFIKAEEGKVVELDDLKITTYCGYDHSFDEKERPNKFSFTAGCDGTDIFYSGDCHSLPPAVKGNKFAATFCWPIPGEEKIKELCTEIEFGKFIMMHFDKFDPGDFFCGMDPEEEKVMLEDKFPGISVIIPERVKNLG